MATFTGPVRVGGMSFNGGAWLPAQRMFPASVPPAQVYGLRAGAGIPLGSQHIVVPSPAPATPLVGRWHQPGGLDQAQRVQVTYLRPAVFVTTARMQTVSAIRTRGFNVSGPYQINGTVTFTSAPAAKRVMAYHEATGMFVRDAWSDPVTGAFSITGIGLGPYTLICYDNTNTYASQVWTGVMAA